MLVLQGIAPSNIYYWIMNSLPCYDQPSKLQLGNKHDLKGRFIMKFIILKKKYI